MEFKQVLIRNGIIGGTLILITVILLLFLKGDISDRTMKIQNQRKDLASRLSIVESLAALRKDSVKAENLLTTLQNSLPTKDQLFGFSRALENSAKSNQLGFGFSFETEIAGTDSTPGINNFIFTVSGSYANFIRFLKSIETSNYFVDFNSFDLSQKGNNNYEIISRGNVFSQ